MNYKNHYLRISVYLGMLFLGSLRAADPMPRFEMIDVGHIQLSTETAKTYVLQESADLLDWLPTSTYILGDGSIKDIFITPSNKTKNFYRFSVYPTNIEDPHDTDNDGIDNDSEFKLGLNPNKINSVTSLIIAEVDSRIKDKNNISSLRMFNNYNTNGNNLVFQRNSECWINDIANITCISPWNTYDGRKRAGTLITPRHVVFCAHDDYYVPANSKIYFVDGSGTLVERTVVRVKRHPNWGMPLTNNNDIVIGVLDQDVPDTILHAKVLPDDWDTYIGADLLLPALKLNQHEEALVDNIFTSSINQERVYYSKPKEQKRLDFNLSIAAAKPAEGLYSGDSGNGGFIIIDSQLVLLNVWTFGGPGSGSSIATDKVVMNTMISELDQEVGNPTGYVLDEFDFSPFLKLDDIPLDESSEAFKRPPHLLVGHRGGSTYSHPENTIACFQRSADLGCKSIEVDVQKSSDGVLFVMHDIGTNGLLRTTDVEAVYPSRQTDSPSSFTIAELKTLDAGSWKGAIYTGEKIPTLKEFLEFCSNNYVTPVLDLKGAFHVEVRTECAQLEYPLAHLHIHAGLGYANTLANLSPDVLYISSNKNTGIGRDPETVSAWDLHVWRDIFGIKGSLFLGSLHSDTFNLGDFDAWRDGGIAPIYYLANSKAVADEVIAKEMVGVWTDNVAGFVDTQYLDFRFRQDPYKSTTP